ncbi:SDR family oxidoreductase [Risungbinella massiliensis]|uniref:SDR family oxidoreductase n=1 Tax=Risungbinella massiliensis TaxID=1329796 RepID=UPI0005CB9D74|nr:SDR family oxidoreductase [Risungbinella massiliensis]
MEQRVAWVVGGVTGLGVPVIKMLAQEGYSIVSNYRKSDQAARELEHELSLQGVESLFLRGDVSRYEEVQQMIVQVMEHFGRVDVLVCTAGPFTFRPVATIDHSYDHWRQMLDGNLSSVFWLTSELIPGMRERAWGRVITFGFRQVEQVPASVGFGPYAAAKTGLVSLTRTLAEEEAKHGITVNMICPGDIRHPFKEGTIREAKQAREKNSVRPGSGEDIARVVQFLVHPNSDYLSGMIIPVTGGFSPVYFPVE